MRRYATRLSARCAAPIALLLVLSGTAAGATEVWRLLASTSVTVTPPNAPAPQRHTLHLPSAARGPFAAVRLAVDGAPVKLDHVVVTFAHGTTQRVDLNKTIDAGGVTSDIVVQGSDHVVRQVDFWYAATKFAHVRLYGR